MNAATSLLLGLFAGNAVLSQYPPQQGLIPPQGPAYGAPPPPPVQPGFGGYPPQQPPMYPQPGFGGAPGFGAPGFGAFGGAFMDPQQLNCEFPGQCRNRRITLTPSHDFQLNCQLPGACDGLDLTLNVGHDPLNFGSGVSQIETFNFDAPTRGVTLRINAIPGQNVEVNHIKCNQPLSCNGLNVIAGFGVETWNIQVDCQLGACINCKVNGMDCNMLSWQHGNNNNMGFGFYNNQPNYGGGYGMGGYPQQQQPASPYGGQYGGGYTTNPPPPPRPQFTPQAPPQLPQYGAPQQAPPAPPAIAPPPAAPQGPVPPAQVPPGQVSNPNTQVVPPASPGMV